jgi:N6-L-threonylcarbamoyladenine synthase
VIATQVELHQVYRGVVPEIASRAHIESILPVLQQGVQAAGVTLQEIDAVAVAQRPGLIGSLLVGLTAAKSLAWTLGKPLVAVDHVQAHLYSVLLDNDVEPSFPAIGLVCSGGHTALYLLQSWTDITVIGKTLDDAVGEAYDKVAAILGLPYPGGPEIDARSAGVTPTIRFPRPQMAGDDLDFSFSGLKTSVLYKVRGHQGREREASALSTDEIDDVCASFQAACVDVLIKKLNRALQQYEARCVIIGGGVSANRGLRAALPKLGVPAFVPHPQYCTDNAAMIAGLGDLLLRAGQVAPLDVDAVTQSSLRVR